MPYITVPSGQIISGSISDAYPGGYILEPQSVAKHVVVSSGVSLELTSGSSSSYTVVDGGSIQADLGSNELYTIVNSGSDTTAGEDNAPTVNAGGVLIEKAGSVNGAVFTSGSVGEVLGGVIGATIEPGATVIVHSGGAFNGDPSGANFQPGSSINDVNITTALDSLKLDAQTGILTISFGNGTRAYQLAGDYHNETVEPSYYYSYADHGAVESAQLVINFYNIVSFNTTIGNILPFAQQTLSYAQYYTKVSEGLKVDGGVASVSLDDAGDVAINSTEDASDHKLSATGSGISVIAAGGGHDVVTVSGGNDLIATGVGSNTVSS